MEEIYHAGDVRFAKTMDEWKLSIILHRKDVQSCVKSANWNSIQ